MKSRNRPQYLPIAVGSVLAQTVSSWELIIIDDCSPSRELHSYFSSIVDHPQIKIIKREINSNRNVSLLWNTALDHIQGKYWAILDDDNSKGPQFCEKMASYLETHPEHDAVACFNDYIDAEGKCTGLFDLPKYLIDPAFKEAIMQRNYIDSGCMMVRAKVINKIGWFDEILRTAEDWEYVIRLLNHTQGFGLLPEPLAQYRRHPGNSGNRSIELGQVRDMYYVQHEKQYDGQAICPVIFEENLFPANSEGQFLCTEIKQFNGRIAVDSLISCDPSSYVNGKRAFFVSRSFDSFPLLLLKEILPQGIIILYDSSEYLTDIALEKISRIIHSPRFFVRLTAKGIIDGYHC